MEERISFYKMVRNSISDFFVWHILSGLLLDGADISHAEIFST